MKILSLNLVKTGTVEILKDTILDLEKKVENASSFVKEIENGNYDFEVQVANENTTNYEDKLTNSLLSLRNKLKSYAIEEKQRNWATEGLANFIDILRSKNDDLSNLTDKIISSLVRYINANQGALYLINEENESNVHLEMTACYAFNKKKYVNKTINLGEGLVGQSVLEKDIIYISDIPQDYLKITSGLGEALPKNLLIVPLMLDEQVFGVLEIASFNIFEKYQIEFVQKLGESIASTISNVKSNIKTIRLLEQSQIQAEEMRSQEEEMRQNMEELSTTQEEMRRNGFEMESRMRAIDHSGVASIEFDLNGTIISANDSFCKLMGYDIDQIKGKHHSIFVSKIHRETAEYKQFWNNLANGIAQPGEFERINKKGESVYIHGCYSIVRNSDGSPNKVLKIATDITSSKTQLSKLQEQEEEMRQNMEELTATQEEVQKILTEVQNKEAFMNNLIDSTNDSITAVDKTYTVIMANEQTKANYKAVGVDFGPGFNILNIFNDEQKETYKSYYDRALNGELFSLTEEYNLMGQVSHFAITYAPIKNGNGEVTAAVVFAKDITETINAKKEVEQLLLDAQSKTEELRAQEEELRQNMEELSTTQEEMNRVLFESQNKEKFLDSLINASTDSIFSLDKNYKILNYNAAFEKAMAASGHYLLKGFDFLSLFAHDETLLAKEKENFDKALIFGETISRTNEYETPVGVLHISSSYAPVKDSDGTIIAAASFGKDITDIVNLQKNNEQLLLASQLKNEELKAQEEEMRNFLQDLSTTQEKNSNILKDLEEKEAYMKNFLNATDDGIASVDKNLNFITLNAKMIDFFAKLGRSIKIGMNIKEVLNTDNIEQQLAVYQEVLGGKLFETIKQYGESTFDIKYCPIYNNKNDIIGVSLISRDITEFAKKEMLVNLKIQEFNDKASLVDSILSKNNDIIFTIDNTFKLLTFNTSLEKMLAPTGHKPSKGFEILRILNEQEAKREEKLFEKAFKGQVFENLSSFEIGDTEILYLTKYYPNTNEKGVVSSITLQMQNATSFSKMISDYQSNHKNNTK